MEKLQMIFKLMQALPQIASDISQITADRFISLHEVLCTLEDSLKAFGLDPNEVGILITKDGDVHLVFKRVLKK